MVKDSGLWTPRQQFESAWGYHLYCYIHRSLSVFLWDQLASWAYVSGQDIGISKSEVDSILDVLNKSGTLTSEEICQRTNYTPNGVKPLPYKLKQAGAVKMIATEERRVDLQSLLGFASVKRWIQELKDGPSSKTALFNFARFMAYVKENSEFETPEELIESALSATVRGLVTHLDLAINYPLEQLGGLQKVWAHWPGLGSRCCLMSENLCRLNLSRGSMNPFFKVRLDPEYGS